jgi:glycosyltransferase involved in cell wall biosynthesis
MRLLSILIPSYNVEKYIEKCLLSIEDLNDLEYEVIIIDDCSTDNTLQIIKQLLPKLKNVSLITNETNNGIGYIRNKLIESASGKYILFIDSDDYIFPDVIKKAIHKAESENCDIVEFSIKIFYHFEPKIRFRKDWYVNISNDGINPINSKIITTYYPALINKIFLRSIFTSIKISFPHSKFEDTAILPLLFAFCKHYGCISEIGYTYIQSESSIINNAYKGLFFDLIKSQNHLVNLFKINNIYNKYEEFLFYNFFRNYFLSNYWIYPFNYNIVNQFLDLAKVSFFENIDYENIKIKYKVPALVKFYLFLIEKKLYFICYLITRIYNSSTIQKILFKIKYIFIGD